MDTDKHRFLRFGKMVNQMILPLVYLGFIRVHLCKSVAKNSFLIS